MAPSREEAYLSAQELVRGWIVRDRPEDEGVSAGLVACGPQGLSDRELVAVMLKSERVDGAELREAGESSERAGSLARLSEEVPPGEILEARSGAARARPRSVVALARRISLAEVPSRTPLRKPDAVARFLRTTYARPCQEVMGVIYRAPGI